jgi:hypothetical protein
MTEYKPTDVTTPRQAPAHVDENKKPLTLGELLTKIEEKKLSERKESGHN